MFSLMWHRSRSTSLQGACRRNWAGTSLVPACETVLRLVRRLELPGQPQPTTEQHHSIERGEGSVYTGEEWRRDYHHYRTWHGGRCSATAFAAARSSCPCLATPVPSFLQLTITGESRAPGRSCKFKRTPSAAFRSLRGHGGKAGVRFGGGAEPSLQCAGAPQRGAGGLRCLPPPPATAAARHLRAGAQLLTLCMQGVADMLATKGVKKAQAEKALDALVEQGKLVRKCVGQAASSGSLRLP